MINLDDRGLIVTRHGDGGDTLREESSYALALRLLSLFLQQDTDEWQKSTPGDYTSALSWCQVAPGVFVRHPGDGKAEWHSDPKETSRDQMIPTIIAMGLNQNRSSLWEVTKNLAKRGFVKYQNSDFYFLNEWASIVRSWWGLKDLGFLPCLCVVVTYPIVWVADAWQILCVLVRCWKARNPDDVGDDWNMTAQILQSQYLLPTLFSWIARKLYKHLRPHSYGKDLQMPFSGEMPIYGALLWYVTPTEGRPDVSGNLDVAGVYKNLIQSM